MTRVETTFLPTSKNVTLYEQLYQQVYKKMYQQLKPLYKKIKEITGYPE